MREPLIPSPAMRARASHGWPLCRAFVPPGQRAAGDGEIARGPMSEYCIKKKTMRIGEEVYGATQCGVAEGRQVHVVPTVEHV
eukprot:5308397-Pyramimonas_sp.AAC.1